MDFRVLSQLNNQRNNCKRNSVELTIGLVLAVAVYIPVVVSADNSGFLFPSDFNDDLQTSNTPRNYYDSHYQFSGDPSYPGMQYSYPESIDKKFPQDTLPETYYPRLSYPPVESFADNEPSSMAPANAPVYNPYTYVTDIEDPFQLHYKRTQQDMQQLELRRNMQHGELLNADINYPNRRFVDANRYEPYSSPSYASDMDSLSEYQYSTQAIPVPVPVMTVPGTLPGTVPGVITPNYMVPGFSHLSPSYSSNPWSGFSPWGGFIPGTGFSGFPGVNSFPNFSTFPYNSGIWPSASSFYRPGLLSPYSRR